MKSMLVRVSEGSSYRETTADAKFAKKNTNCSVNSACFTVKPQSTFTIRRSSPTAAIYRIEAGQNTTIIHILFEKLKLPLVGIKPTHPGFKTGASTIEIQF